MRPCYGAGLCTLPIFLLIFTQIITFDKILKINQPKLKDSFTFKPIRNEKIDVFRRDDVFNVYGTGFPQEHNFYEIKCRFLKKKMMYIFLIFDTNRIFVLKINYFKDEKN